MCVVGLFVCVVWWLGSLGVTGCSVCVLYLKTCRVVLCVVRWLGSLGQFGSV